MKSQHVAAIQWLADATDAEVDGLSVGSKTITFTPSLPPTALSQRKITVKASTGAASALLILQGILPFLVFAADDKNDPVELEISGGTNVSFSLSYEYFDQILAPTLETRFGIEIERQLKSRSWSLGTETKGSIWLKVQPVPKGQSLNYKPPKNYMYPTSYEVRSVDATIIVPQRDHEKMQQELVNNIGVLFPDADINFKLMEDSQHDSRWSVLLVAHSVDGLYWGKDVLCSLPKKVKSRDTFISRICSSLCKELYEEVERGGQVDEHLQDQVICFQALCEGVSSFPRSDYPPEGASGEPPIDEMGHLSLSGDRLRREKTHEPFGNGSMHTQTARWVASELIPKAQFYSKGNFVQGAGFSLV